MPKKLTEDTTSSVGIKPFNDHLLVEIHKSAWATADEQGEQDDPRAGSAVVVAAPELKDVHYLSSYTWVAEESVFDDQRGIRLHQAMTSLVGKRVYFEKRSEIGNTIEVGDKVYAVIKLSKITAVADE